MPIPVDPEKVSAVGEILNDGQKSLSERFRALFTLRNIGGHMAIDCIARCFQDESVLLKHELAFCLGQMQDEHAIPILTSVLKDTNQEPMVRHEAGEALGAIGSESVHELLKEYAFDPVPEVAETCQLAAARISWLKESRQTDLPQNPYLSVDPAPPSFEKSIDCLKTTLLDENSDLFERYRAMFALRNLNNPEAALALAEGLRCPRSALFRHEIAYVLGQMQQPAAVPQLVENLQNPVENAMVRHECAEALGAIATDECDQILRNHVTDSARVVSESCVVALDMSEYEHGGQLEYADGLQRVNGNETNS